MKTIFSILLLTASFQLTASVCGPENKSLLWESDTVIEQYECSNSKMQVCASKAIHGLDNNEYVAVVGNFKNPLNPFAVNIFSWKSNDENGEILENDRSLVLTEEPLQGAFSDNKFRFKFELDKDLLDASYLAESSSSFFSRWKVINSEKLNCTKIQ
jgi:hypothetical protein